MKLPIYLDYAATCPVDERVAKKMMAFLTIDGTFGNPASRSHKFWPRRNPRVTRKCNTFAFFNCLPCFY